MIAPILFLFAEGKPSLFKCFWPTLGSSELLVLIPFTDKIKGNNDKALHKIKALHLYNNFVKVFTRYKCCIKYEISKPDIN